MFAEIDFGGADIDEKLTAVFSEAGEACFWEQGISFEPFSVSVAFKQPDEMQELNRIFRGIDAPTDVLTFPVFDSIEEASLAALGGVPGIVTVGDIAICPEAAKMQAQEYGHGIMRELVYLFVHGMFHILGFDHESEEERGEMREREERVMVKLGLMR
jgi:probable rRNA maturation factor